MFVGIGFDFLRDDVGIVPYKGTFSIRRGVMPTSPRREYIFIF